MSRHDRKLESGFLEDRLREMDHQRAQATYRNRLCVTVHKGNIYRIMDITDKTADSVTFEKDGRTFTVAQYFRDEYHENVEGKQVVEAKEVRGGSRICHLPVNLLRVLAQAPPVRPHQALPPANAGSDCLPQLRLAKLPASERVEDVTPHESLALFRAKGEVEIQADFSTLSELKCSAICALYQTTTARPVVRPKSAQETLVDCAGLVNDILRTPAVREQMSELKLGIGEEGLPLDVQEHVRHIAISLPCIQVLPQPHCVNERDSTAAFFHGYN